MIKRREYSKVRRPVKRSKFIETIYTKFAYVEFVFLWLFVMGCDFLVEFRFEYFWPFYLLIKNVHDSFKLQGLTFSVLFVVVALALDMICFMLLPVHWLFFVASTYVWLQYVWHTERELCIISASMCLFYIYIEAAVRFRDIKTLPFTLDLCRPFAAHCIGYPFVTFGFGVRNYFQHKARTKKKEEIVYLNSFCMNVMDQDWSSIEDPDNSCLFPSSTSSASAIVNRNSISASSVAQHPPHSKHTSWIHNHQNHYQPRPQTVGNKATSRNLSAADDKENQSDSNVGQTKAAERTPDDETIMDKFVANCLTNCDFQMVEHILKTIVSLKDFDERKATAATKIVFKSIHKAMSSMANDNSMTTTISTASSDGDVHSNKWPNTSNTFSSTGLEKPKNSNQQVHDKPNTSSQTQSQLTTSTTTKAAIESISISDTSSNISINNGNNSNHKISDNQFTVHNNSPLNNHSNSVQQNGSGSSNSQSNQRRHKNSLSNSINNPVKDDQIVRLESDIKRLKADLQIARQLELDLHDKLTQQNSKECDWRHRLTRLQQDNENLQTKLHNLVTARQQDKQTINSLERKLQREKKSKTALEQQLSEQQLANEVQQQATQSMSTSANRTGEYSLMNHPTVYHVPIGSEYKSNGQKIKAGTAISLPEPEGPSHLLMQLKKQSQYSEFSVDDQKYQNNAPSKEHREDTEMLLTALSAMQEKNSHLELSLTAETKMKVDLFTALGETRRQLDMCQMLLQQRDKEVDELMSKLAELMIIRPNASV